MDTSTLNVWTVVLALWVPIAGWTIATMLGDDEAEG